MAQGHSVFLHPTFGDEICLSLRGVNTTKQSRFSTSIQKRDRRASLAMTFWMGEPRDISSLARGITCLESHYPRGLWRWPIVSTCVIPAKAGIQRLSSDDPKSPPSRGRQIRDSERSPEEAKCIPGQYTQMFNYRLSCAAVRQNQRWSPAQAMKWLDAIDSER
jgi:hypothetical protein